MQTVSSTIQIDISPTHVWAILTGARFACEGVA
jgi:hypothetical protein